MAGLGADYVAEAVRITLDDGPMTSSTPAGYEIADTSNRVVRFIMSTFKQHDLWAGIRRAGG